MTTTQAAPWSYGGTGLTLGDLDALPRHEREAILAGTVAMLRDLFNDTKQKLLECESLLRDEMLKRGATVVDAGEWEVKLTARRRYDYDEEALSRLQAFVEPEQYDSAVKRIVSVKVDKRVLNQLRKRGGDVARIIDAATVEEIAGYDMEIGKRKR